MSNLPYYPRYPRDFFEGTAGMAFEEKAAYGLILDLIYMMGERGLPDDARFIAGHLSLSIRKWNTIRSRLMEIGKISISDGIISNKRADNEKIIQRKYLDKQRENRLGSRKNNNLNEPASNHTDTDIDIGGGVGSAHAPTHAHAREESTPPEVLTWRERILTAIGVKDVASGITVPTGKMIGTCEDMLEARAWITDLHLTEDEVISVVSDLMAGKTDGMPRSFRYFRFAMQRFAARKTEAPLTIPQSDLTDDAAFAGRYDAPADDFRRPTGNTRRGERLDALSESFLSVGRERAAARRAAGS